ncbi:hypothetical protein SUGI_0646310 [Cryptomeria japonica]|nr:hypothetical protein SUGI_0646310 [Cryptomeria japonica]
MNQRKKNRVARKWEETDYGGLHQTDGRKTLNREVSGHSPWPSFVDNQEEVGTNEDDWCAYLDKNKEEKLIDLWFEAQQVAYASRQVVVKSPSNGVSSSPL